MSQKRYHPEEIIAKLRQAEVLGSADCLNHMGVHSNDLRPIEASRWPRNASGTALRA